MDTNNTIRKTGSFIRNSATIKIISIGILVLVLLIPTSMISSLLRERESRRDSVVQEINKNGVIVKRLLAHFLLFHINHFTKTKTKNFDIQSSIFIFCLKN